MSEVPLYMAGPCRSRANLEQISKSRPDFGVGVSHFSSNFLKNVLRCSLLNRGELCVWGQDLKDLYLEAQARTCDSKCFQNVLK